MNAEQVARQKRAIANQLLLAEIVQANAQTIGPACDMAIRWLQAVLATYFADGASNFDHELTSYLVEAGGFQWHQDGHSPEPSLRAANNRSWVPDVQNLEQEVSFIVASMSSRSRAIAKQIDPPAQVAPALNQTLLYKMQCLNYLNRKVCLMAEYLDTAGNLENANRTPNNRINNVGELRNTALFQIFNGAQRVRCSTFDSRAPDLTANADDTSTDLAGFFSKLKGGYKKEGSKASKPFYQGDQYGNDGHRRRKRNRSAPHADASIMSIDAGASITTVLPDSTLGRIARELGLPERCDISGTTTDAVGAAAVWAFGRNMEAGVQDQNRPQGNAANYYPAYLLACMTSMTFLGHHSLSEMAAAASLWSGENYKPFDSTSLVDVLNYLLNQTAGVNVGNLADPGNWTWIEDKWQTLRLHSQTPVNIEFDDRLWNTTRFIAGQ